MSEKRVHTAIADRQVLPAPRYPLIVVDWAKDRDDYTSGWLRLFGPADLASVPISATSELWDADGYPVTLIGGKVAVSENRVDPDVREVLVAWRRRVPFPIPGAGTGETAIPFMIDDIVTSRARLTPLGRTYIATDRQRVAPIVVMVISALLVLPLVGLNPWFAVVFAAVYGVTASLLNRWSYPAGEWGNPPRVDPPDRISRLAKSAKTVFLTMSAVTTALVALGVLGIVGPYPVWA